MGRLEMITYRVICTQCGQLPYAAFDTESAQFESEWHTFHYGTGHVTVIGMERVNR
jgi:hypothetical protein